MWLTSEYTNIIYGIQEYKSLGYNFGWIAENFGLIAVISAQPIISVLPKIAVNPKI